MDTVSFGELHKALPTAATLRRSSSPYRVLVKYRSYRFPLMIHLGNHPSQTLLTLYNGAVDRARSRNGIVFQRSSWIEDFKTDLVAFADPTLLKNRSLTIGWSQLSEAVYGSYAYAIILRRLREVLDLAASERTVHFGSSAGGFQAISTATYDRGSSVVANNPQLDWSRYLPAAVEKLTNTVYAGRDFHQIYADYPHRVRVSELFRKHNYAPQMDLYINALSPIDLEMQVQPFLKEMETVDGVALDGLANFHLYFDRSARHSPKGRAETVKMICERLDATTN